jgi:hypothetical protein
LEEPLSLLRSSKLQANLSEMSVGFLVLECGYDLIERKDLVDCRPKARCIYGVDHCLLLCPAANQHTLKPDLFYESWDELNPDFNSTQYSDE